MWWVIILIIATIQEEDLIVDTIIKVSPKDEEEEVSLNLSDLKLIKYILIYKWIH